MADVLREHLAQLAAEAGRVGAGRDARITQAELRRLIDQLPLAALVANDAGLYVETNKAASALTGYPAAELNRLSVWHLTPLPNAREGEVLWRAFLQQGAQSGTYSLLTKDGRIITTTYAAQAHVLPGLHVSLLRASDIAVPR